jgi:hypothetical protein
VLWIEIEAVNEARQVPMQLELRLYECPIQDESGGDVGKLLGSPPLNRFNHRFEAALYAVDAD